MKTCKFFVVLLMFILCSCYRNEQGGIRTGKKRSRDLSELNYFTGEVESNPGKRVTKSTNSKTTKATLRKNKKIKENEEMIPIDEDENKMNENDHVIMSLKQNARWAQYYCSNVLRLKFFYHILV